MSAAPAPGFTCGAGLDGTTGVCPVGLDPPLPAGPAALPPVAAVPPLAPPAARAGAASAGTASRLAKSAIERRRRMAALSARTGFQLYAVWTPGTGETGRFRQALRLSGYRG